ncbi:MAG: ribonuclease PH [Deltaproteobacteria bacterium]|jgi:ribonuclease PH|nr:ribonuclease PH [Deltaproteobacteria bacterium]
MRADGRAPDQLRPVSITSGYQQFVDGSALIKWGNTWVLCAASVEESVPPFRLASGGGWITAEYNMLPGSTRPRKPRRPGGREKEIQRLVGRSLRAAVDLDRLGPRTITVDCDVLQADGGTRVASITGGYVALALAIKRLQKDGLLAEDPSRWPVAAVSVGVIDGEPRLDLPYEEDSRAEVDLNLVLAGTGDIIELQGTAEGAPFSRDQLNALLDLGWRGIEQLCDIQTEALSS